MELHSRSLIVFIELFAVFRAISCFQKRLNKGIGKKIISN
jgi:hypothetical protein